MIVHKHTRAATLGQSNRTTILAGRALHPWQYPWPYWPSQPASPHFYCIHSNASVIFTPCHVNCTHHIELVPSTSLQCMKTTTSWRNKVSWLEPIKDHQYHVYFHGNCLVNSTMKKGKNIYLETVLWYPPPHTHMCSILREIKVKPCYEHLSNDIAMGEECLHSMDIFVLVTHM